MSDELRAAANEIITAWESRPREYEPTTKFIAAKWLAEAYIAEHPADDDEPVTEEWVASISPKHWDLGQEHYWPDCGLRYASKIGDNGSAETEMWYFDKQTVNGKPIPLAIKTRGDVRRLLAALGIEVVK